jgi:hypothetical protein
MCRTEIYSSGWWHRCQSLEVLGGRLLGSHPQNTFDGLLYYSHSDLSFYFSASLYRVGPLLLNNGTQEADQLLLLMEVIMKFCMITFLPYYPCLSQAQ